MYNHLILMVHKLVTSTIAAPDSNQHHVISWVNAIAVTGQLSLIDGVTDAINVQVAKNKGDLEQEIVILS